MLVVEARSILTRLGELEEQSINDRKLFFLVIESLIDQIERYGRELDAAMANLAVPADYQRRNLWDLLRELEQLTLDDPLLSDRIGLIRSAFAASFNRATTDLATRDSRAIAKDGLAWMTLPASAEASPRQSSDWPRATRP